MGKPHPPKPTHAGHHDDDGEEGGWSPSLGLLAIALGLVAGALAWWWQTTAPLEAAAPAPPVATRPGPTALAAAASANVVTEISAAAPLAGRAAPGALHRGSPRIPRLRDPNGDQSPDLADYVNEGEQPTMAEVIARLHQAGVYTGLGAFSPPGTRPPLLGLAVPEDFALPPGYVRHYQATDDGQRIEPILMFAPDYQPLDAARRPLALPADRVVPPELAPPGLPIRRIVVPAPTDGSGRS